MLMPPDTALFFGEFEAHYRQQNFGAAVDAFARALQVAPGRAFRHFMTLASGPLARTVGVTRRTDEVIAVLNGLLADHPHMHLLAHDDAVLIARLVALRESNIAKGLPSIAVLTQGKSASIPVANIFNSGFKLPSFAYSLATLAVIDSFARDFARGGACYSTHLEPTTANVRRLKAAGIDKVIVHVRDPRQSLLSMVHHVTRYPDQMPELARSNFHECPIDEQIDCMIGFYFSRINWIQGWLEAESELNILFSTFEDFVLDRTAFTRRCLAFYGHEDNFSCDDAMNADGDQHFRLGRTDEWREVFPKAKAEFLTSIIPTAILERFGWPA